MTPVSTVPEELRSPAERVFGDRLALVERFTGMLAAEGPNAASSARARWTACGSGTC